MWVFGQRNFMSMVQSNRNPEDLVVRTRCKADADYLVNWLESMYPSKDFEIITKARSDYPWRVIVTKQEMIEYQTAQIDAINYGNFKDSVKKVNPARAGIYGQVWHVLLDVEDEDGPLKRPSPWAAYYNERLPAPSLGELFQESDYRDHTTGFEADGDDLLTELDDLELLAGKSLHSLTEAEWEKLMQSGSGVLVDDDPPLPDQRPRNRRRDRGGKKGKRGSRR